MPQRTTNVVANAPATPARRAAGTVVIVDPHYQSNETIGLVAVRERRNGLLCMRDCLTDEDATYNTASSRRVVDTAQSFGKFSGAPQDALR
jgi:hypothetical protein